MGGYYLGSCLFAMTQQPNSVPVKPRCSRTIKSSGVSASTVMSIPLTFNVAVMFSLTKGRADLHSAKSRGSWENISLEGSINSANPATLFINFEQTGDN